MKFALILFVAICSAVLAAPVDDASTKEKRGLALGLGYHAPLLTHATTHYVAPAVVHHEPLYHAPIYTHHAAPLIAHAPVSYHLPATYHSFHHLK